MNLCVFKGNITREIVLTFAQGSGLGIAKFGIAVSRMKKDDPSDFFNCTAFGKTAETIANNLVKGSPILINGHLQSGKYDKDGHTVYTTDVIVDRFEFISKKEDAPYDENKNLSRHPENETTEVDSSDIPFN